MVGGELSVEQLEVLVGIQKREAVEEISDRMSIPVPTVYEIIRGLRGQEKNVPKKWRTHEKYVEHVTEGRLKNENILTVEGLRVLDQGVIRVDVNVEIEAELREDLRECKACGHEDEDVLQEHHIIPLGMGGRDIADNRAVLCSNCHNKVHMLIYRGYTPTEAFYAVVRRGR